MLKESFFILVLWIVLWSFWNLVGYLNFMLVFLCIVLGLYYMLWYDFFFSFLLFLFFVFVVVLFGFYVGEVFLSLVE